jgi:hypothetical protein
MNERDERDVKKRKIESNLSISENMGKNDNDMTL